MGRPKTKRKHKKNSAHKNLNETLKTDTELFSQRQRFLCNQISVSEDETNGGSMTTETEDCPRFDSLDSGISSTPEAFSSQEIDDCPGFDIMDSGIGSPEMGILSS